MRFIAAQHLYYWPFPLMGTF